MSSRADLRECDDLGRVVLARIYLPAPLGLVAAICQAVGDEIAEAVTAMDGAVLTIVDSRPADSDALARYEQIEETTRERVENGR